MKLTSQFLCYTSPITFCKLYLWKFVWDYLEILNMTFGQAVSEVHAYSALKNWTGEYVTIRDSAKVETTQIFNNNNEWVNILRYLYGTLHRNKMNQL